MPGHNALVVGIDRYSLRPLKSCVSDATRMAELLERNGSAGAPRNYDVYRLLGDEDDLESLTREGLRNHLAEQVAASRAHNFLFYFSGHGRLTPFGPELVTQDLGGIGMDDVIGLIDRSEVRQAVVILDCCFSAGMGNSSFLQGAQRNAWVQFDRAVVRENVVILAASGSEEVALAGTTYSAFTELLIEGLDGAAADVNGEIHAAALFEYAAPIFGANEQGPVFKGHYHALDPLRTVEPEIPLDIVRSLVEHFPIGTSEVVLSATDVAEGDSTLTPAQARYEALRTLRRYGLVDPGDDRDLEAHAAEGSTVRLTALGMGHRRLACAGRV